MLFCMHRTNTNQNSTKNNKNGINNSLNNLIYLNSNNKDDNLAQMSNLLEYVCICTDVLLHYLLAACFVALFAEILHILQQILNWMI